MDEMQSGIESECGKDNSGRVMSDAERRLSEIDAAIARVESKLRSQNEREKKAEAVVTSNIRKKMITMIAVMIIAVVTFAGSTFAYYTSTVDAFFNQIESGRASVEFVDLVGPSHSPGGAPGESTQNAYYVFPGDSVTKDVRAVNNGTVALYVRARVESVITLDSRYASRVNEIDPSLILIDVNDSAWKTKSAFDGYYYYSMPLEKNTQTTSFLDSITFSELMGNIYKGSTVTVKVVFEVVQSSGNGSTVFDAAGWPLVTSEGGEP